MDKIIAAMERLENIRQDGNDYVLVSSDDLHTILKELRMILRGAESDCEFGCGR